MIFRNTRSKFYKKKHSDLSTLQTQNVENTGQYWKNKGNQAFAKGYFQTAIDHYTKAIEKNDGESIYFSNRAKSYWKLNMIEKALKDAQSACELDDQNIKAHYICGCILGQAAKKDTSKMSKAQNRLKKALRLCDTLKKGEFIDSISIKLFRLKKLKYLQEEQLLKVHNSAIISLIKKSYVEGLIPKEQQDKLLKEEEIKNKTKVKQIPDHMLCKITLQIMEEPVTTDAGFTYQKSALEDHLKMNELIQPITRQSFNGKSYPNKALKQGILIFLEQNPWAFQFSEGESYDDIEFL